MSGIGLGGINLELIQSDLDAPIEPVCDTLVFEPVSLDAGSDAFGRLGFRSERYDKWESDSELLKLRGFSEADSHTEQLICSNLYPDPAFPVPLFLCKYSHDLGKRLSRDQVGDSPAGPVIAVEVQLEEAGKLSVLSQVGYLGSIELVQRDELGPFKVTGIKLERGPMPLDGLNLGFEFILAESGPCSA